MYIYFIIAQLLFDLETSYSAFHKHLAGHSDPKKWLLLFYLCNNFITISSFMCTIVIFFKDSNHNNLIKWIQWFYHSVYFIFIKNAFWKYCCCNTITPIWHLFVFNSYRCTLWLIYTMSVDLVNQMTYLQILWIYIQ